MTPFQQHSLLSSPIAAQSSELEGHTDLGCCICSVNAFLWTPQFTTSFLHVNLNETAANTAQDRCGEPVLWICETEVLGMSTARAQSSPECWRSKKPLSASPTRFLHEGIMAQHYPWSLSGVKVQAVRTFGISESLCKQVRINIFASEALEKKKQPPSSSLLGRVGTGSCHLLVQAGFVSPDLITKPTTFTAVITATGLLFQGVCSPREHRSDGATPEGVKQNQCSSKGSPRKMQPVYKVSSFCSLAGFRYFFFPYCLPC